MSEAANVTAATHILRHAPAIREQARARGWVDDDGWADWDQVQADLPDYTLSGGQGRIAQFALALARAELWGLDGDNYDVVAKGLRLASDECARLCEKAREAESWFGRARQ